MKTLCENCSTIITKIYEKACDCTKIVDSPKESGNTETIQIVCSTIITIILIAAITIIVWQLIKVIANCISNVWIRCKEKKDKCFEQKAEYQKKVLEHIKEENNAYVKAKDFIDKHNKTIEEGDESSENDVIMDIAEYFSNHPSQTSSDYANELKKYIDELNCFLKISSKPS